MTNSHDFLVNLPIVLLDELCNGDNDCGICQEPYCRDDETKNPVVLPCGHIFCDDCMVKWFHPENMANTCPKCRRAFFELDLANKPDDEENGDVDESDVISSDEEDDEFV